MPNRAQKYASQAHKYAQSGSKNILCDRYETHWKENAVIVSTPISHNGIDTPRTGRNLESEREN